MNKDAHVIAISHERLYSMTEDELRAVERFNKQKMLKELIEEMSIDDVKHILNVKGYVLLTRSESEAIINYMGIKSTFGEVFK